MNAPSASAGSVSVVIVSHQSAATIGRCLDGVLADAAVAEALVVDNASDDATVAVVERRRGNNPRTALLRNAENRGFSAACNQGAAAGRGAVLLFLNPDAFIAAGSISRMSGHLAASPDIGLLGVRVVDETGRAHGPQRRREPTWRRSLMTMTGLARFERRWPALAGIERAPGEALPSAALEDVDAVNGAAMMLPRVVFDRIGGFDEAFFLHAEDLDLCRRVRDAGYRVVLDGDVTIAHIGGVSGRRRPFAVEWQKTRSLWHYFRKHEPRAGLAIRALVALGLGLRYALKLPVIALRRLRG